MDLEWWKLVLPLAISVLLAMAGFGVKYLNDLSIARRKDRLDRVSRQLGELYGPLLALTAAGNAAWATFRGTYRPSGSYWRGNPPPNEQEASAWRLWMRQVFMPLNERMAELVLAHADLLDEEEMPACLLALTAHVFAYRAVLKQWEQADFSEHTSPLPFPREALTAYASAAFRRAKREQARLLGQLGGPRAARPEAPLLLSAAGVNQQMAPEKL